MTCGIYEIRNRINGKVYIGLSVNVDNRIRNHKYKLKRGNHDNPYLQKAYSKSKDAFFFSLIEECKEEELEQKEIEWINHFNSNLTEHGYNLLSGGVSCFRHHETSIKKMKISSRLCNTKLSYEDVKYIKMSLFLCMDVKDIADLFNTTMDIVYKIKQGNESNFGWVLPELNGRFDELRKEDNINLESEIVKLMQQGYSALSISNQLNIPYEKVLGIFKTEGAFESKKEDIQTRNKSMREEFKLGISKKEILKKYKISASQYNRILGKRLSERKKEIYIKVIALHKEGISNSEIGKIFNLNRCTVGDYVNGKIIFK
ncbi:GIY-YIG nuclease family protein [Carnobacterium antarcticum]|uniref:GIY-YIG nuclease family protein n=1 Tax=Carnobacterium antarcticum TaxID=2126436 RepID=A0ABW4NML6_9LACT|nr:GIY-YIG nuclease family protein [Carnobacterium sp. CP1]ALV21051.1 hypothetical protein NY10_431 [Carnobacterium sp. CP1]